MNQSYLIQADESFLISHFLDFTLLHVSQRFFGSAALGFLFLAATQMFGAFRRRVVGAGPAEADTSSSSEETPMPRGQPQAQSPAGADGGNDGGHGDGGNGDGGNDGTLVASSSAPPASSAESGLAQSDAARQARLEIAQSVKAGMSSFEPGALLNTREEMCRFACHPASAPSWFQQRYNTTEVFTWAFCGFDPVVSSFYPSGSRTHNDLVAVTFRFLNKD